MSRDRLVSTAILRERRLKIREQVGGVVEELPLIAALHRAFAEEVGEEDESADALRDFVAQGGLRRVFYDTRRPPTGDDGTRVGT